MDTTADRRGRRGLVLGLILVAAGPSLAAADQPLTPDQIRERMSRVRADIERTRSQIERKQPGRSTRKRPATRPELPSSVSRGLARDPLQYRFRRGDTFAYSVEVTSSSEGFGRIERFQGTPHITVMSVAESGEAELFVIGKLECSTSKQDGSDERDHPRRAVWLGSRIAIKPDGGRTGKPDIQARELPDFLETLHITPKHLIFPEILRSVPGRDDAKGKGSLFGSVAAKPTTPRTFNGMPLVTMTPAYGTLEGMVTRTYHADAIEPPLVRLTRGVAFESDPKATPHVTITYTSTSRFDRTLGRLRDTDATFRQERTGSDPAIGSIHVHRLEGDALRQAHAQALVDWQERPDELDPIEFRRVAVDAFLPNHLDSVRDAHPGMAVLHLRTSTEGIVDADQKYYSANILEVGSKPQGPVTIRYKGSDEVVTVPYAVLAFPVSPEHPGGRAPRPAARAAR